MGVVQISLPVARASKLPLTTAGEETVSARMVESVPSPAVVVWLEGSWTNGPTVPVVEPSSGDSIFGVWVAAG